MKYSKSYFILLIVGIIFSASLMCLSTYAYFSLVISGSGNENSITSFNESLQVTYVDTSNVTLVNAYTGDSITKTFTVENTGDALVYYDIILEDLVNNFANPDDLVYSISSTNNGANLKYRVIPTTDNAPIASNIPISSGTTHSYTMIITFLKTSEDQSANMGKTFSSNINIIPPSKNEYVNRGVYTNSNSLGYKILNNNTLSSDASLSFNSISSSDGLYYNNSGYNGSLVYYFRGSSSLNNNVRLGSACYKIIRTTEDGGIRMIYNGPYSESTYCANSGSSTMLDSTSAYNTNSDYNAYVGYMYGTPGSTTYIVEHTNTNESLVKTALTSWYTTNISTYASYLSDSIYCNNRKSSKFTINSVVYGISGYGTNNSGYDSAKRLQASSSVTPSLDCPNSGDRFSSSSTNGNGYGTNPIGLLTADEAVLAGYTVGSANTSNYLYNTSNYWTMTPAYFNGSNAYVYAISSGNLTATSVSTTGYGIRPVITLKNDVVCTGDGSSSLPYYITTN